MIDLASQADTKQHNPGLAHPPKPRLTVRVGITGHRPDKLDGSSIDSVVRHLPTLFAAIENAALDILAQNEDFYVDRSRKVNTPQFRLITGFAEGADLIAVDHCPNDWAIEAVLPFPEKEFIKDFAGSYKHSVPDRSTQFEEALEKASSRTELPAPSGAREKGYVAMGGFLLRQIDVLIAIWDGEPPAKPGGTGAVVTTAVREEIPVIWILSTPERFCSGWPE
jgi:hypothetical protein